MDGLIDVKKMKYLAAYLLLTAGGNAAPSNDDIKTLLASAGVEAEDSRVASLLSAVEGKNINEVIFCINYFWHHPCITRGD